MVGCENFVVYQDHYISSVDARLQNSRFFFLLSLTLRLILAPELSFEVTTWVYQEATVLVSELTDHDVFTMYRLFEINSLYPFNLIKWTVNYQRIGPHQLQNIQIDRGGYM